MFIVCKHVQYFASTVVVLWYFTNKVGGICFNSMANIKSPTVCAWKHELFTYFTLVQLVALIVREIFE